jgi:hypothetical protein
MPAFDQVDPGDAEPLRRQIFRMTAGAAPEVEYAGVLLWLEAADQVDLDQEVTAGPAKA